MNCRKRLLSALLVLMLMLPICALTEGTQEDGREVEIPVETPTQAPAGTEAPVETAAPTAKPRSTSKPKPTATPAPKLPINFSAGKAPQAKGFNVEKNSRGEAVAWKYRDPTITVSVTTGREASKTANGLGCAYWVATIKIRDASQLRTLSNKGFDRDVEVDGVKLAKRANAVLAIDGDYYPFTGEGFILRQGKLFKNAVNVTRTRDVLLIDEDGDFHGLKTPKAGSVKTTINGKKVINAFYFGPLLVLNGKAVSVKSFPSDKDIWLNAKRQRMAIAQVGPLEYKCICCAGPARGSEGMTVAEFTALVAKQKVKIAYNLDGGDSTMMIFNGSKINDVKSQSSRKLMDIIYFASAYEGK